MDPVRNILGGRKVIAASTIKQPSYYLAIIQSPYNPERYDVRVYTRPKKGGYQSLKNIIRLWPEIPKVEVQVAIKEAKTKFGPMTVSHFSSHYY